MGTQVDWRTLAERAWAARENAYAPYSKFFVGAALATESGEIFTGCNVENASYGLTICAERVAVGNAVSAGHRQFTAIALAVDSDNLTLPCGACRQFLAEFNPALRVYSTGRGGSSAHFLLSKLLPSPFPNFRES